MFVIDLSSIDASNKHGDKIKELSSSIESWTNRLLDEYEDLKKESDEYSSEILNIVSNLVSNEDGKIKLNSVGENANYEEVIEELKNLLKDSTGGKGKLGLTDKENIQIAVLQISNRVDEINERTSKREIIKGKLEQLNSEIDKINDVGINNPEEDAGEETEVSLDDYRDMSDEEIVIPEGEVEDIYPANDELVANVEEVKEEPEDEFDFNVDFDSNEDVLSDVNEYNSEDDDDESGFEIEIEDDETEEAPEEDDEQKVSDYFDTVDEESAEEDSYKTFTLGKSVSLVDISQRVYGEADYWKDLYEYDTNKEIIDTIADASGVDSEEICTKKGRLNGVTLKFPLELVTYESEDNE